MTGEVAGRTEPYRGHDGMRQYFRDVASVWEELRLTPREFRTSNDLLLVTGRVSARSRSRTVTGSTGWIWRVRDGQVVYVGYVRADASGAEEGRRRARDSRRAPAMIRLEPVLDRLEAASRRRCACALERSLSASISRARGRPELERRASVVGSPPARHFLHQPGSVLELGDRASHLPRGPGTRAERSRPAEPDELT